MLKPTILIFFSLSCIVIPAYGIDVSSLPNQKMQTEGFRWKERWINRRLMIGSTAPTCSYNECRGCRFSCSAEQVPVDANDPINSAYHYRCVCHRRE